MFDNIREIVEDAVKAIGAAGSTGELEEIRVRVFGKKGSMTQVMKAMGSLPAEERPAFGQATNQARLGIEERLKAATGALKSLETEKRLAAEVLDITMPGKIRRLGARHPLSVITEDLCRIFTGMGFEIAEGPEIETAYHNFTALNTPAHHPARDEQDTFYMSVGDLDTNDSKEGEYLLRTQTSPVQVRVMESKKPPIRVICPGKVYRRDDVDATHSPIFHQMEGLVVDKDITLGDLKGALTVFAKELLGERTVVRFRPHYFPFTEPSGEMDVRCFACDGVGCRVCKNEGWVELLGCGMVHPDVLRMCDIDPDVYSGYAFGMGLDRLAMAKFNILDMRLLFENDVRFLEQFA